MPIYYTRNCNQCGQTYSGRGKNYCSNSCAIRFKHKTGVMTYPKWGRLPIKSCPICGKQFKPVRSKDVYCSKKCFHESITVRMSGKNHPMWKNGKSKSVQGYILVSQGKGVQKLEHRLVMEKHLGRKLLRTEHVHHINGDKTDNSIENLSVLSTSEHNRLHAIEQWKPNGSLRNR